jgi:aromatic ring-opening dioxygenase catalytic subunit (LigB family)
MQAMVVADPLGREKSGAFDRWLTQTCTATGLTPVDRERRLIAWEEAPHARFCHPREEHLLPLHVCFGAAGMSRARIAYEGEFASHSISGFLW